MNDTLLIDRQDSHWTFTLNRPNKRNALSSDLIEAFISGIDAAHAQDVPTLIFQGNGKNFSAGFDFSNYETQSEGDLVLRMIRIETLLQMIAHSSALTVAFAHGKNFGAGVDIFAACTLRYATPDATFRMPGLKFGLVLGTRRFRNIVGTARAMSILGDACSFNAQESLEIGFLSECCTQNDWSQCTEAAINTALALDTDTRRQLYGALNLNDRNADMAALVRSASRPGIKDRIKTYLGR